MVFDSVSLSVHLCMTLLLASFFHSYTSLQTFIIIVPEALREIKMKARHGTTVVLPNT